MEMITIPVITAVITPQMPIWTGNHEMKMAGIKESGILGGMRWWYEAILRGFGVKVCNPCPPNGSTAGCQYNDKRARKSGISTAGFYSDNGTVQVCPACQLFGCTGWSKQFTMQWDQDHGGTFAPKRDTYAHPNCHPRKKQATYMVVQGRTGQNCRAVFYPHNDQVGNILHYLLQFLGGWGGFGARPQMGCGMSTIKLSGNYAPLLYPPQIAISGAVKDIPDLRDFFFCQLQLKAGKKTKPHYDYIEVKYRLRQALAGNSQHQQELRHYLCGEVQGNIKKSAKIFISRPFAQQIVVRGYLPRLASIKYDREAIIDTLLDSLYDYSAIDVEDTWVEFKPKEKSYRDWALALIAELAPLDLTNAEHS